MNLPDEEVVTDAVCFHSQQSVEKLLKSFLVLKGIEFGKTHNLEFLLELCAGEERDFEGVDVGNLSYYVVEIRYPNDFHTPSLEEAISSLTLAREVKEFIFRKLGIRESDLQS